MGGLVQGVGSSMRGGVQDGCAIGGGSGVAGGSGCGGMVVTARVMQVYRRGME